MKLGFVLGLVLLTTPAVADEKLVNHAKLIGIDVRLSFDACVLGIWKNPLYDCQSEKHVAEMNASVNKFRAALKAQNKSDTTLKDYIITYRKVMAVLGPESTERDIANYRNALTAKSAAVVAELEW